MMDTTYTSPLALEIISGVFLGLGAACALLIAADIVLRKGWRTMMWIMIPVYIINATYMLPVTLFVYYRYGRPPAPQPGRHVQAGQDVEASNLETSHCHNKNNPSASMRDQEKAEEGQAAKGDKASTPHCHHHSASRPLWATVLVGVSHCGAGCVLGDLVGEWLVYGTGAKINNHSIWAELLIDYAFALLFGILFQYFSIAPMSGEYGPKSLWRAAKADVLSLTGFEVGAFGWMVAYQVGIWGYGLEMSTWTYWWMMQVGMVMGFATAMPVNWYLIRKGIKEPCA